MKFILKDRFGIECQPSAMFGSKIEISFFNQNFTNLPLIRTMEKISSGRIKIFGTDDFVPGIDPMNIPDIRVGRPILSGVVVYLILRLFPDVLSDVTFFCFFPEIDVLFD